MLRSAFDVTYYLALKYQWGKFRGSTIPVINQAFQPLWLAKFGALIAAICRGCCAKRQNNIKDFKSTFVRSCIAIGLICWIDCDAAKFFHCDSSADDMSFWFMFIGRFRLKYCNSCARRVLGLTAALFYRSAWANLISRVKAFMDKLKFLSKPRAIHSLTNLPVRRGLGKESRNNSEQRNSLSSYLIQIVYSQRHPSSKSIEW